MTAADASAVAPADSRRRPPPHRPALAVSAFLALLAPVFPLATDLPAGVAAASAVQTLIWSAAMYGVARAPRAQDGRGTRERHG
jgi:hypothetical protein